MSAADNPSIFPLSRPFGGRSPGWLTAGVAMLGAVAPARSEPSSAGPLPPLNISYLAELPVSWRTGLSDPLQNIARSLGSAFSRPVDLEYPLPANNLFGADSWEELSRRIQLGGTDLFPLQGYELLENGRLLGLKPLLLTTRNGNWQTRFVLLASSSSEIQTLRHLEDRTILVYRDGCGDLVDYWLDTVIAVGTGRTRKSFARYQTVTQPREAVLPVFFGEADACVISTAAYRRVLIQNPVQIPEKLNLVLAESKDLPSQVVACRMEMPAETQRRVLEQAPKLAWDFGEETGGMIAAQELAFDNLRALMDERAKTTGTFFAPTPPPQVPGARFPASTPAKPVTPEKRP